MRIGTGILSLVCVVFSSTSLFASAAPTARIDRVTPSGGPTPLNVTCSGSGTDDNQVEYHRWDFGDGSPSADYFRPGQGVATQPTHLYTRAGTYTITLTVEDQEGQRTRATATLVVTPGVAPAPVAVTGYTTVFDSQYDGDFHVNGLWNVDATPAAVPGGAFRSAPSSLNFNNRNGNFNTGGISRAEAVSPVININHLGGRPELRFWCNYATDTEGALTDRRIVQIKNREGAVLASYNLARTGGSPQIGACAASSQWHVHSLLLDPAAKFIKVAFVFDSTNTQNNDGAGWFIDDFSVLPAIVPGPVPVPVGPTTVMETSFEAAGSWTMTGLWATDATPRNPRAHMGSATLNYNNGSNYRTGSRTSGNATSPAFDLAGRQSRVTFWCNYFTETTGTRYDQRWIRVVAADGGATLLERQLAGRGGAADLGACQRRGEWHQHTLSLGEMSRRVKIVFAFDSIDEKENRHSGWFVDDLKVVSEAGVLPNPADVLPPTKSAAFATNFMNAGEWTLQGLWSVDATPATVGGGAAYEGNSLNFNNGLTYNTGAAVSGTAVSGMIDTSFLQTPVMTFKCNYDTDTEGAATDKRLVRIISPEGMLLREYQLARTGGAAGVTACGPMRAWHEHSLRLDDSWSLIRVSFTFDSVNSTANDKAGWFVDDVFFDLPDIKNVRRTMYDSVTLYEKKLEFSTASGNSGYAPLTASRDLFEFDNHPEHNHIHFTDFVEYRILNSSGVVARGRKTGFCFVNSYKIRKSAPDSYPDFGGCRTIKPGFADVYGSGLTGQEIDVDGVEDGLYFLEYLFDPLKLMSESDEENNSGAGLMIRIEDGTVTIPRELNP